MKKTFRFFFAAVAAIVFASCADKMGNEINAPEGGVTVQDGNLVQMTFSASMEEDVMSKTTLESSDGSVLWEATDAITVFSVGEESVTRTSFDEPELFENGVVARFSGLADASAETYYAVYPDSEANTYDNGTFSVVFPHTHVAVANGFPSGSNVSVAVVKDAEGTEQILQFKNVGALLAFSFNAAEDAARTKSVTFKARKSADNAETPEFWGLTGDVTVTIDENGLPIASAGNVDHVTLNAPEGGFELGKDYFIPVCPVGYCAGIQVVFTDQDDQTFVKNNDIDFQLLRSDVFNAGKVILPYDDLPRDDFTITINFAAASWPLEGDGPVKDQETWSGAPYKGQGEAYTYYHTYTSVIDGEEKKLPLEVIIARERGSSGDAGLYTWVANKGLSNPGQLGVILFPGIQNRYLKEVGLIGTGTTNSSSAFGLFEFGKGFPGNSYGAGANKESIYRLYEDKIVAGNGTTLGAGAVSLSQPVGVRLRRPNTITSVRLVYSATSPGNAPTE